MKMVCLEFQTLEIVLLNMPGERHTGRGGSPKAGQVVPAPRRNAGVPQVDSRWRLAWVSTTSIFVLNYT